MIEGAVALFERLPIDFGDPLGLAAQQAPGHLTLIVVRYGGPPDEAAYDAFVCRSGQIVTVARMTPAFRFPILPARALRRFIEASLKQGSGDGKKNG